MSETTQNEQEDSPKPFTAEDILARYRPSPDPIVIDLPTGESMTFSPITSTKARKELEAKILSFINNLPDRNTILYKNHIYRDVLPDSIEELFLSLYIHFRSMVPHIDMRTAFEYHQAPDLIEHIEKRLGIADKNLFEMRRQKAIEDAQKKSLTPGNDEGSPSASEPSQGATPTS